MKLRPGSVPWFLAHDLRQSVRGVASLFGGLSRFKTVALVLAVGVSVHLMAWPAAWWIDDLRTNAAGEARIELWFAAGTVMSLSLIVAQSMTSAMRSFYSRGDFDLLLSSPVSVRAVLASRALALAIEGAASGAFVLLPLANMGVLLGRPHWLAIYPWLFASALVGAAVGLSLAMLFFITFGPRRARGFSQVAATLVGASFVITAQVTSMLPARLRDRLTEAVAQPPAGSWLDHKGALWLPVRAAMGDTLALVSWLLFAGVLFSVAVSLCGRRMADVAALASGSFLSSGDARGERPFRGGLSATLAAKERMLIWRDPWLLSQILLQIIYTFPLSIVLWQSGDMAGSAGNAFAPSIVMIAAQLSGSLAWVTLSGEDAPDFLATAPVTRSEIERVKIGAIALPVGLLLGVPLVGLALASPWGALCAAAFSIAAGLSTALVNFWRHAPAKRGMVLRRHSQSKLVGFIELLLMFLWTFACAATLMGTWIAIAPAALALFVLFLARPRSGKMA